MRSIILSAIWLSVVAHCISEYHEDLLLKPLAHSAVLASFTFRSNTSASAFQQQNFRYFPRSLGQILQHAHTQELHLRFTSGRWDDHLWGGRPRRGTKEGGTGVELWGWLDAPTLDEAELHWLMLTNALSGLFCASLNFIDLTRTTKPVLSFLPEGQNASASGDSLHLFHGTLPREVVCTENLTPFLKLLPCKGKAGVSSLFDGHKLFDSSWQSMAIDVKPICQGLECVLQIEQSIDMVLDIERSKRPRDDPIPRPLPVEHIRCDTSKHYAEYGDSCYPLEGSPFPDFTLEEVWGKKVRGSCPLIVADGEEMPHSLCIDLSSGQQATSLAALAVDEKREGDLVCYAMPAEQDFDLNITTGQEPLKAVKGIPWLLADRTLTGHGQQHGGMKTILTNPSANHAVEFVYFESLPWFMKPYLHTLQSRLVTVQDAGQSLRSESPPKRTLYRPAVDRQRSTHLELLFTIPPNSKLTITYDFEKSILRYMEYPPDANRGFDAPSAIITVLSITPTNSSKVMLPPTQLRTPTLLLYLPTPDFSMPYNVIILTSTVIALGFGSIFNLLVRRFVSAEEAKALRGAGIGAKIRARLQRLRVLLSKKGKPE